MLPLYLLTNAKGQQVRIELKSGEVIEGELTNVDNWMNVTLANVSEYKSSDNNAQVEVLKSAEIYLKGIYIKYIKLQDDIISTVKQQINNNQNNNNGNKYNNRKYHNNNRNYNNNQGSGNRRNNYNNRDVNRRHNNNNNNNPNYQQQNRRSYHQNSNSNNNEYSRPSNDGTGGYVQHHTIFNNDNDNKVEF
ncbi:similar to Saccharomyces cerevisiae YER112W LSM4 Lsm (Like Sm) protein [Maudiozyma barnettii]|uniref:LSM complex subunit LSM4 n=1 Tax=Maudiozyma barnettii TaxID=61262 RepID=A0A8H2VBD5_9SACH|nr:U6 snRNA complex subunit LSM4 [Kazachstania barnettii]CAB4252157.1 similar to Saccharomyces cerevisiae YER112W LSM4 Lsm (Like Sm) protein [Kazachstania barnettii]CAD1778731.1 similar to Saccharomyces cerevisiae YER112W LSM4 Lsm (Like Sm) protein [Kazachstania barnettii]